MVAIVFDYRNLFDILKSIDFVENCVWLPLCLGPRMHEGQNRVPGSIKRTKLGYMTAVVAWERGYNLYCHSFLCTFHVCA